MRNTPLGVQKQLSWLSRDRVRFLGDDRVSIGLMLEHRVKDRSDSVTERDSVNARNYAIL